MPQNTGGGYNLSVLPQIQQVDPRLFTTGGQFIGGLNSGFGAYGALQNIGDEAAARPIKRQLANIQLADAQNRLELAPLEQQLRLAQISEAQQNAAFPRELVDAVEVTGGSPSGAGAFVGDTGEFYEPKTFSPEVKTTSGKRYVGGDITPFTKTETLATPEAVELRDTKERLLLASESRRLAEQESLAKYRQEKNNIARQVANNPDWARGQSGADSNGNLVTVYFNKKNGQQITVPTDLVPIQHESESAQILGALLGGKTPAAPVTALAPDITAAIDAAVGTPVVTESVTVDLTKPISAAQAAKLAPGTAFIGLDGVRRTRK